jgi:hypothetical protein
MAPTFYRREMVSVRQFQVTFDCASPERVALFWCEALGSSNWVRPASDYCLPATAKSPAS